MKHFLLFILFPIISFGQEAPNFIEMDLDSITHNLYEDYLDQGKAVYLDLSATWCGPCRALHETGYFNEFYDVHGPNGYGDGYVFFIESDAGTSVSQLYWNGVYSYVEESNFPIIDDADESIYDTFGGDGYPTVCLVCPDKTLYLDDQDGLYWSDIVSAEYLEDMMYEKCGESMIPSNNLDASIIQMSSLNTYCGEKYYPKAIIRNMGKDSITSLDFEIYVNGNLAGSYLWTGLLHTYEKTEVLIPYIEGSGTDMTVVVSIVSVNGQVDDLINNNSSSKIVALGYYPLASDEVNIALNIDQMGWQCEWEFFDPENNIIGSQYYYPTGDLDGPLPDVEYYTFSNLNSGCYTFSAYDALANGLNDYSLTEWGSGGDTTIYYPTDGFVFTDINGDTMASIQTYEYYNDYSILIGADSTGGFIAPVKEQDIYSEIVAYPNPTSNAIYIEAKSISKSKLELFNLIGQSTPFYSTTINNDKLQLDMSYHANGLYFLKMNDGAKIKTLKIIVEN